MRARVGADDLVPFDDPVPGLLEEVSGIRPEARGIHVLLEDSGVRSTQRLAMSTFHGGVIAALWPGELKEQALYLYGERRASPMVAAAIARGWFAMGSPHLAFRNSAATQRLYMIPACDASVYAARWEDGDLRHVGQHDRREVETVLWPWLRARGYADRDDRAALDEFLTQHLGNRAAFLRPGLRLKRHWSELDITVAGGHVRLAPIIRADVNAILGAAGEPPLPAT